MPWAQRRREPLDHREPGAGQAGRAVDRSPQGLPPCRPLRCSIKSQHELFPLTPLLVPQCLSHRLPRGLPGGRDGTSPATALLEREACTLSPPVRLKALRVDSVPDSAPSPTHRAPCLDADRLWRNAGSGGWLGDPSWSPFPALYHP